MVLFAMFLFAGCSDEAGELPVNTDTTQDSTTGEATQEPQDVLDETLDTELIADTTEEVEIGSLI